MQMQKGANPPVDGSTLDLRWAVQPGRAELDVSAYLVTSARVADVGEGRIEFKR